MSKEEVSVDLNDKGDYQVPRTKKCYKGVFPMASGGTF